MNIMNWLGSLPGAGAQGIVWGLMAIGVFVTYKILDIADLTVDGSMVTGAAVCAVLVTAGVNVWVALLVAVIVGMLAGVYSSVLLSGQIWAFWMDRKSFAFITNLFTKKAKKA